MADKKSGERGIIAYVFGVLSIVMAFFTPLAGIVFGIIGLVQSKKEKTPLSKRAKKLSTIGIVLSLILFAITIALTAYLATKGMGVLPNFPA
ncbi:DUF4190 domain-containing protein [Candidatus Pacearchaeota archaeon]|nr:DUF4190 domain-containing protein [Candidatus Pacearchaeota archaeon]